MAEPMNDHAAIVKLESGEASAATPVADNETTVAVADGAGSDVAGRHVGEAPVGPGAPENTPDDAMARRVSLSAVPCRGGWARNNAAWEALYGRLSIMVCAYRRAWVMPGSRAGADQ